MQYLDVDRLNAIDQLAFRSQRPYPWANPVGLLTDKGFRTLVDHLPAAEIFREAFDEPRRYGQRSHNRYVLDWEPGLTLVPCWREFIEEIRSPTYRQFAERLLGTDRFDLRLHWHYTPNGCSVSPHCDAKRKLGSHVFYFNTSENWDPSWGGETLILDDNGRFHRDSDPDFEDFEHVMASQLLDNRSLIFVRSGNSWHGMRQIRCPEDRLRRVFIAVFEKPSVGRRLRQQLLGR